MDNDTRDTIKSKFLLGAGSEDQVIPKQTLVEMSSSLTSIETSFNQLKAYTGNILRVQAAMQKAAIVSMKKASSPLEALQALEGGSQSSTNDQITTVFPQLTQIIDQLHKSLNKLDLSGQADAPSDKAMNSVAGAIPAQEAPVEDPQQEVKAEQKTKAKIAVKKQNERTDLTRQPIKPASEIAKKSKTSVSKPQAPARGKTETKVEKQLTQTATKAVGKGNVGATPATKAQPTGNVSGAGWTTKLSGFIGKSVTNVKSSIADFLANIGSMLGIGGAAAAGGAAGYAAGSLATPDEGGSAPTGGKAGDMEAAINKAGIKDNTVKAQMMAQTAHESGNFKYTQELGNAKYFEKYNGRKDLGNTQPGDGPKYRGRGFLQVTGRANYAEMSKLLGVDFVNNPEALAQPKYAAASAIAWFQKRWGRFKNWGDTKAVTKVVNGGYNGLADRSSKFAQYSRLYGSGGSAGAASAPGGGGGGGPAGRMAPGGAGFNDNVKAVGGNIKQYANLGSNVNYEGLKPTMKRRFTAMAAEHYQKTGKKLQINSALRTRADQERMWKKYGPKRAAPPGRSLHESGVAIDVNTPDVQRLQKLGLLKKYGFWLPYFPKETWHLEPVEGSKAGGQPDNPYQPGAPVAQREKGKEVVQDSTGKNRQITAPKKQVGPVATGMAIQRKVGDKTVIQNQSGPIVVAGGSNPMSYLTGMKPAKGATTYNVNTSEDYKVYFNAA
jgi:putative chitinase